MSSIFDYNGKFTRALQKVSDVIVASFLWIVGCLPLFTIGTSTTALYYASIKGILGEGGVVKNFVKSYKENLKQSIVIEVILLIVGIIMYLNWKIIFQMSGVGVAFKIIYIIVLIWLALVTCYVFPILARFSLSTKLLFINAFIMSVKNLPKTVFIILTSMLPVVCLVVRVDYVIKLLPLIIAVVPGLIAYLNATMFVKIFEPYMPKEEPLEDDEIECIEE